METFPNNVLYNLAAVGSDHSLVVIFSDHKDKKGPKRFKFESIWLGLKHYGDLIRKGWDKYVEGSFCFKVVQKLKNFRLLLKDWYKKRDHDGGVVVRELLMEVDDIQNNCGSKEEFNRGKQLQLEIKNVLEKKKKY
ncbi:hypothetical protein PTKIN_Ptkin16aG0070500 [Pterospermum kingtungense]